MPKFNPDVGRRTAPPPASPPQADPGRGSHAKGPAPKSRGAEQLAEIKEPAPPMRQRALSIGKSPKSLAQTPILPSGSLEYSMRIALGPQKKAVPNEAPPVQALPLPKGPALNGLVKKDPAARSQPPMPSLTPAPVAPGSAPSPTGPTSALQGWSAVMNELQGGSGLDALNKTGVVHPDPSAHARRELQQDALLLATSQKGPAPKGPGFVEPTLDPGASKALGTSANRLALDKLGTAMLLRDVSMADSAIAQLGRSLAEAMRLLPPDQQHAFVVGQGDRFIHGLLAHVDDERPGVPTAARDLVPEQREIMDRLIDAVASQLSDHVESDGKTLVLGGISYTRGDKLGSGFFGAVYRYQSASGATVVVKVPKGSEEDPGALSRSERTRSPAQEGRALIQARGQVKQVAQDVELDASHLTPFRGAVRTATGEVWLVTEFAELGDAESLLSSLERAHDNGHLTDRQALQIRLTLLRDVLLGARQMQEAQGLAHLDLRAANFLLDGDGSLVIGDFGLARPSKEGQIQLGDDERFPVKWSSPEVASHNRPASDKSDLWSLGIFAHELLFGDLPAMVGDPSLTNLQRSKNLKAFGDDTTHRMLPNAPGRTVGLVDSPTPAQRYQASLGLNSVQKLVNSMLHPDPDQRPTLQALLETSLLSDPALGGPDVRTLIQQVATDTLPPPPVQDIDHTYSQTPHTS